VLVISPTLISGTIEVEDKEKVGLLGKNGTGKTTIIKSALCDGTSRISVDGEDFCSTRDYSKLSVVLQEPYSQVLAETFKEELRLISKFHAVDANLAKELMGEYMDKKFLQLSDGYKKRYVIASVLISKPKYVLLDEPFANLDREAVSMVKEILPLGSLIAEHRTREIRDLVDRVYLIDEGKVEEISREKLYDEIFLKSKGLRGFKLTREREAKLGDVVLEFQAKGMTLKLREREVLCLVGKNGVGKTTTLKSLVGKAFVIFQNPDLQFFHATVREEVKGDEALELFGLKDKAEKSPYALSYGEKMRVLIASAFSSKSKVIALDEPSTGMDGESLISFQRMIDLLVQENRSIIIATHDEDIIGLCDTVVNLEK